MGVTKNGGHDPPTMTENLPTFTRKTKVVEFINKVEHLEYLCSIGLGN